MLTARQRSFALEYLTDGNATQAAIRAGYAERSAHVTGSRLLRDGRVQALLSREQGARRQRLQFTADHVERRLWEIANEDRADRVSALALLAKRHLLGRAPEPLEGSKHLDLRSVSDEALYALLDRLGPPPVQEP